jgi:hypothetical protein
VAPQAALVFGITFGLGVAYYMPLYSATIEHGGTFLHSTVFIEHGGTFLRRVH